MDTIKSQPDFTEATYFFDYQQPAVRDFVDKTIDPDSTLKQQVTDLYLAVRDGWWYDPYTFHIPQSSFKSSEIIQQDYGNCLTKSILLISCYRCIGVPSGIHLAKVKNHIAVERIVEKIGTDELTPHGFVELNLNNRWIACTPAFNKALCEKSGVDPLEFDGENDSVFQAYNRDGNQFMEYLEDYGAFADFPYDFVMQNLEEHYPFVGELKSKYTKFKITDHLK